MPDVLLSSDYIAVINSFNCDEVFVAVGFKKKINKKLKKKKKKYIYIAFILLNYLLFSVNINDSPSLSFYKNNEF